MHSAAPTLDYEPSATAAPWTRNFCDRSLPPPRCAQVLKIAPETSIKFLAFDQLKLSLARDPSNVTVSERFAAGGAAGDASTEPAEQAAEPPAAEAAVEPAANAAAAGAAVGAAVDRSNFESADESFWSSNDQKLAAEEKKLAAEEKKLEAEAAGSSAGEPGSAGPATLQ